VQGAECHAAVSSHAFPATWSHRCCVLGECLFVGARGGNKSEPDEVLGFKKGHWGWNGALGIFWYVSRAWIPPGRLCLHQFLASAWCWEAGTSHTRHPQCEQSLHLVRDCPPITVSLNAAYVLRVAFRQSFCPGFWTSSCPIS
jgi:hypothetical protein